MNKNEVGFFMKIDTELKNQFKAKCAEKGSTVSDTLKNYMKQYIKK